MSDKMLDVRLIQRNDIATNWSTKNPILIKGEFGIETDTNKVKIGDGILPWNELVYAIDADSGGSGFSVGVEPPTDKSVLWVDTNATPDNNLIHALNLKDQITNNPIALKIVNGRLRLESIATTPDLDKETAYYYNFIDITTNKIYEFSIQGGRIELEEKVVSG